MKRIMSYESISNFIASMRKKDKSSVVVKNNLAYYMDLYDVSVEAIADRIGSTPYTINAIISGKHIPSAYLCLLISLFFDLPVNSLFYLDIVGGDDYEKTV